MEWGNGSRRQGAGQMDGRTNRRTPRDASAAIGESGCLSTAFPSDEKGEEEGRRFAWAVAVDENAIDRDLTLDASNGYSSTVRLFDGITIGARCPAQMSTSFAVF